MRLVDADALIAKFAKEAKRTSDISFAQALMYVCTCLDCDTIEQPTWIPVTEKLPDAWTPVLLYVPSEHPLPTVGEGYIGEIGRFHAHRMMAIFGDGEVTHWMPLPQPPKGNNHE